MKWEQDAPATLKRRQLPKCGGSFLLAVFHLRRDLFLDLRQQAPCSTRIETKIGIKMESCDTSPTAAQGHAAYNTPLRAPLRSSVQNDFRVFRGSLFSVPSLISVVCFCASSWPPIFYSPTSILPSFQPSTSSLFPRSPFAFLCDLLFKISSAYFRAFRG